MADKTSIGKCLLGLTFQLEQNLVKKNDYAN
jgi:hypothetical protein